MFQLEHPWSEQAQGGLFPGDQPVTLNTPWVIPAATNQISTHHLRHEATKDIRSKRDCIVQQTMVSTQQKGARTMFWRFCKGLFSCDKKTGAKKPTLPLVLHDQQRASEHGPHAALNPVQVHSSTFRRSLSVTIAADHMWRSLDSIDDVPRTGNWPETTLPPPYDWPATQFPSPPVHNIRLNPFLQHHCNGPHPIAFDISHGPDDIMHNTHTSSSTHTVMTPPGPADLTQLATYPSATHMDIQVVAEDPLPHFPWPIQVANAQGITCDDVFDAIRQTLLEHVSEEEYNTWTKYRREAAARTYHRRVRISVEPTSSNEAPDGLRRIDYLGESMVIFHGMEWASAMVDDSDGTWFMFFGASERDVSEG